MDGIEPLLYAEPNPTSDEEIKQEVDDDNIEVTKIFIAWWASKMEDSKECDQGR